MYLIVGGLVLGSVAGILGGMFGIGGGLIIVPGLILVFGLGVKSATGTSLCAQLLPVGILAVAEYWRRGEVDLRVGAAVAVGLFLGMYLGSKTVGVLTPATMKRLYAVFLIGVAIYFLYTSRDAGKAPIRPSGEAPPPSPVQPAEAQVHLPPERSS